MPQINIRVSDEQFEALRVAADEAGLSTSEYVRENLEGHAQLDARIRVLEAWHERSREMLNLYEKAGWKNPLENGGEVVNLKGSDFRRASEFKRHAPIPKK